MEDRKALSESKEKFHKKMAKLPFERKVAIVKRLQRIAKNVKSVTS